ncbi:hypothetical protein ScPMuIL_006832 [Solemya velum]
MVPKANPGVVRVDPGDGDQEVDQGADVQEVDLDGTDHTANPEEGSVHIVNQDIALEVDQNTDQKRNPKQSIQIDQRSKASLKESQGQDLAPRVRVSVAHHPVPGVGITKVDPVLVGDPKIAQAQEEEEPEWKS